MYHPVNKLIASVLARSKQVLLGLLCASGLPVAATALDSNCSEAQTDCVPVGEWKVNLAIGLGMHSNPIAGGDDIPLVLIPTWRYYGERFYVENFEFGFSAVEKEDFSLDLFIAPSFDQVFFENVGLGNFSEALGPTLSAGQGNVDLGDTGFNPIGGNTSGGITPFPGGGQNLGLEVLPEIVDIDDLHPRRIAIMSGVNYSAYFGQWIMKLQALKDISGVHDGSELRFAASRELAFSKDQVLLSAGFTWQSSKVLNYYYGIGAEEVLIPDNAYSAQSGVNPFLRFDWHHALNKKWSWKTTVQYSHLDDTIAASPLVTEDHVLTVFTGGVYHF